MGDVKVLKGRKYLYYPLLLSRYLIVKETPKFAYLGDKERFNLDTETWESAPRNLMDFMDSNPRVRRATLDNPTEHGGLWTYFDPRWIERARRDRESTRHEQERTQQRWEKKRKGFRAYDAFGNERRRVWAQTAEEALSKEPRVVYVEYGDGFGGIAECAGRKPKALG